MLDVLHDATRVATAAYRRLLFGPLIRLYLDGPTLHGWGFWGGRPAVEVCAALSDVSAQFWERHPEVCAALVDRNVETLVVAAETVLYYLVLAKVASVATARLGAWLSRAT